MRAHPWPRVHDVHVSRIKICTQYIIHHLLVLGTPRAESRKRLTTTTNGSLEINFVFFE